MDDELRTAFATLSAQMADVGADARAAAERAKEAAHAAARAEAMGAQNKAQIERLEKHVFGSEPPPPLAPPVLRRVTESEGDIDDLTGQVLAVRSELAEVKQINQVQTQKLGLEADGFWGIVRNATAKDVIKLATLLAAAYAAFHQAVH